MFPEPDVGTTWVWETVPVWGEDCGRDGLLWVNSFLPTSTPADASLTFRF